MDPLIIEISAAGGDILRRAAILRQNSNSYTQYSRLLGSDNEKNWSLKFVEAQLFTFLGQNRAELG